VQNRKLGETAINHGWLVAVLRPVVHAQHLVLTSPYLEIPTLAHSRRLGEIATKIIWLVDVTRFAADVHRAGEKKAMRMKQVHQSLGLQWAAQLLEWLV
jgi:hypothetical protein